MKVVLGLLSSSRKKMKIKMPMDSFEITFHTSPPSSRTNSGCMFLPKN